MMIPKIWSVGATLVLTIGLLAPISLAHKLRDDWNATGPQLRATACGAGQATPGSVTLLDPGQAICIDSPNFPNDYPNNFDNFWGFQTTDPASTITINCSPVAVEGSSNCAKDRLIISHGCDWSKYCGAKRPTTTTACSKWLRVTFKTNGSVRKKGFKCWIKASEVTTTTTDTTTTTTPTTTTTTPTTTTSTTSTSTSTTTTPTTTSTTSTSTTTTPTTTTTTTTPTTTSTTSTSTTSTSTTTTPTTTTTTTTPTTTSTTSTSTTTTPTTTSTTSTSTTTTPTTTTTTTTPTTTSTTSTSTTTTPTTTTTTTTPTTTSTTSTSTTTTPTTTSTTSTSTTSTSTSTTSTSTSTSTSSTSTTTTPTTTTTTTTPTTTTTTTTTTTPTTPSTTTTRNPNLILCECGIPFVGRIVGGIASPINHYPWLVGISDFGGTHKPFCGGSIVNNEWIVTAAHCVKGVANPNMEVLLNMWKWNVLDAPRIIRRSIDRKIIHPQYNSGTYDNDIALLHLETKVSFTNFNGIKPICLPPSTADFAGQNAVTTGWGTTSSGGTQPVRVREVTVPIRSETECDNSYPGQITQNMICAGFPAGGKDSCQGDSGGPLTVPNGAGKHYLAGVVSWGEGCAFPNKFGVYTDVPNYIDWITQNAVPGRYCLN